jgi:hypothetical protein
MRERKLPSSAFVFLAASAATVASAAVTHDAHASVAVAMSVEDLARTSDVVARVTPIDRSSKWEEGRIMTFTRVRLDEVVAGSATPRREIVVRTRGGVVDGIGQSVSGEAQLEPGTSSFVFLSIDRAHATAMVSGRAQGQLVVARVAEGREVVRVGATGTLVSRTIRAPLKQARLAVDLDGVDALEARREIARAWEVTHAR